MSVDATCGPSLDMTSPCPVSNRHVASKTLCTTRSNPKDDRAPRLDLTRKGLSTNVKLRPGIPAAPGVICLRLLPSGPDRVHNTPLHRTQSSAPHASVRLCRPRPQRWEFSPAIADCGLQDTATSPPSTTIASCAGMMPIRGHHTDMHSYEPV